MGVFYHNKAMSIVQLILNSENKLIGYSTEVRTFEDVLSDGIVRILIGFTFLRVI